MEENKINKKFSRVLGKNPQTTLKYFINFILLFVFFIGGFFLLKDFSKNLVIEDVKQIVIGGQTLNVDLALTPLGQTQGLSGRSELRENEGMLFVFEQPGKYSFWMKDMKFPLDIIWIGEDMNVIYIQKNASPESYPESFVSEKNAKYVLEVFAGFADKNNLKEGDKVEYK
ncbi:MAG: DUF192 domain-containing protein [Candidatus Paceibacterota bacterium]|jgi:hypothetical protein